MGMHKISSATSLDPELDLLGRRMRFRRPAAATDSCKPQREVRIPQRSPGRPHIDAHCMCSRPTVVNGARDSAIMARASGLAIPRSSRSGTLSAFRHPDEKRRPALPARSDRRRSDVGQRRMRRQIGERRRNRREVPKRTRRQRRAFANSPRAFFASRSRALPRRLDAAPHALRAGPEARRPVRAVLRTQLHLRRLHVRHVSSELHVRRARNASVGRAVRRVDDLPPRTRSNVRPAARVRRGVLRLRKVRFLAFRTASHRVPSLGNAFAPVVHFASASAAPRPKKGLDGSGSRLASPLQSPLLARP
jgi:hypothetical protein